MTNNRTIIFLLLIILGLSACAGSKFVDTLDHQKDWDTILSALPAYPQSENLLEFDAGPTTSMRYFIDANSISVDKKRVIRYSLVIQSAEGVNNVSFEGIRCDTRERKRYANGNNDSQSWIQARASEWQFLEKTAQLHAQRELVKYYFCPRGLVVGSATEAVRALKAGRHPLAGR